MNVSWIFLGVLAVIFSSAIGEVFASIDNHSRCSTDAATMTLSIQTTAAVSGSHQTNNYIDWKLLKADETQNLVVEGGPVVLPPGENEVSTQFCLPEEKEEEKTQKYVFILTEAEGSTTTTSSSRLRKRQQRSGSLIQEFSLFRGGLFVFNVVQNDSFDFSHEIEFEVLPPANGDGDGDGDDSLLLPTATAIRHLEETQPDETTSVPSEVSQTTAPTFTPTGASATPSIFDFPSTKPSSSLSPKIDPSLQQSQSVSPTDALSSTPSSSQQPSLSEQPSLFPSSFPTTFPSTSTQPSHNPSVRPTNNPTASFAPSDIASAFPSDMPSVAHSTPPSERPTPEPNCTSTTDGPVEFIRYLALSIEGRDANVSFTRSFLQDALLLAYNQVAECEVKGSFRTVTSVEMVFENQDGSTTSGDTELVFRLNGRCDGCSPDALKLFHYDDNSTTSTVSIGGDSRVCDCKAPSGDLFFEALTTLAVGFASTMFVYGLAELEESDSCMDTTFGPFKVDINATTNTTLEEESIKQQPIGFSSTISMHLLGDETSLDPLALATAFQNAYQSQQSFVSGMCANYRRTISSVEVELHSSTGAFSMEETGFTETLFHIEGFCFACDPERLFAAEESPMTIPDGNVDLLPSNRLMIEDNITSPSCLCPIGESKTVVSKKQFHMAMSEEMGGEADNIGEVIEVYGSPCPSQLGEFSTSVLLELNLAVNSTGPAPEEMIDLQDAFVMAYNVLTKDFCDPFSRHLTRAQVIRTSPAGLFSDDPYTIEIEVFGSCRNCLDKNITLYDSVSFLTNIEVNSSNRNLQLSVFNSRVLQATQSTNESDSDTCYCALDSIPDQGPSEVEAIDLYGDLVDSLNLTNIASVGDCKFITVFETSVILSFKGDATSATQAELDALGKGFIDSYNRVNSGDDVCDRQFRQLTNYKVEANITLNEEFLEQGGLKQSDAETTANGDIRVLSRTRYNRRDGSALGGTHRQLQFGGNSTNFTSASTNITAPTPSPYYTDYPTIAIEPTFDKSPTTGPTVAAGPSSINILLYVGGTCRGCQANFGLFDQVATGRRRLQAEETTEISDGGGEVNLDFLTVTGSCFCPLDAIEANPSEDNIVHAFEETVDVLKAEGALTFVEELEELEEVTVVQCVVETNGFETVLVLNFFAVFDQIGNSDIEEVKATFNTTYNQVSESYCDALFRRSQDFGDVWYEQASSPDESGFSRVKFYVPVKGRCRDCEDGASLLEDDDRRRHLKKESRHLKKESNLCFCDAGSKKQAPSRDDFDEEYRDVWNDRRQYRGRRLNSHMVFAESGLPNTQAPTPMPSVSPSERPSTTPSDHPSPQPSSQPSSQPSVQLTELPSALPSKIPSMFPTSFPSEFPSEFPSAFPSEFPSLKPSALPSLQPSLMPSESPSDRPSGSPSSQPTSQPTITGDTMRNGKRMIYVLNKDNRNYCGHSVHRAEKCGGDLASFSNLAEFIRVMQYVNEAGTTSVWLGAQRDPEEETNPSAFFWADQASWYSAGIIWAINEPDIVEGNGKNHMSINKNSEQVFARSGCVGNKWHGVYLLPIDYDDASKYPDCVGVDKSQFVFLPPP